MDKFENNCESGCEKVKEISEDFSEVLKLDVIASSSSRNSSDFLHQKTVESTAEPENKPDQSFETSTETTDEAAKMEDSQDESESWIDEPALPPPPTILPEFGPRGSRKSILMQSIFAEIARDSKSILVKNVHSSATKDLLRNHFQSCGSIKKATILKNRRTGLPKGLAYIEFEDSEAKEMALALNKSIFLGQEIKVKKKQVNRQGLYLFVPYDGSPPTWRLGGRDIVRREALQGATTRTESKSWHFLGSGSESESP